MRSEKLAIARTFRDLRVYQYAEATSGQIFVVSQTFPAAERYSLTDQIRRSSRAVKAMIAEAWGRRRYKAVFVNKLDEALGEITETQSWLDDASKCGYLSGEQFSALDSQCEAIGKMLSRMIDRAGDFCKYSAATDFRDSVPGVHELPTDESEALPVDEFFT